MQLLWFRALFTAWRIYDADRKCQCVGVAVLRVCVCVRERAEPLHLVSNMRHRGGLKVKHSVGGSSHYCNDESHTGARLPTSDSLHFLPLDLTSLKRDSPSLALLLPAGRRKGYPPVPLHASQQLGRTVALCLTSCFVYICSEVRIIDYLLTGINCVNLGMRKKTSVKRSPQGHIQMTGKDNDETWWNNGA